MLHSRGIAWLWLTKCTFRGAINMLMVGSCGSCLYVGGQSTSVVCRRGNRSKSERVMYYKF